MNREKAVLIIAETGYKVMANAELDNADPEIKARVMHASEQVVDELKEKGLLVE